MLKNKYQRMNKDEKMKLIIEYYNTPEGKEFKNRINRVLFFGFLASLIAIYLIIDNIMDKNDIWQYSYAAVTLIAGIFFIISHFRLKTKILNKYAIKK